MVLQVKALAAKPDDCVQSRGPAQETTDSRELSSDCHTCAVARAQIPFQAGLIHILGIMV